MPKVGDRAKITTVFVDEAGTPTSPTVFNAEYRRPGDPAVTAVVPTDGGSGVFTTVLPTFDVGGVWSYYIRGTAGVIAASDGIILVDHKATA